MLQRTSFVTPSAIACRTAATDMMMLLNLALMSTAAAAPAELRFATSYGDHMVRQRPMPHKVTSCAPGMLGARAGR